MNWINHVKQYAKQHNISYPQALKEAKMSYGGRLVKTKEDEELFDNLYKTGSQTVYVPPQMAFINNRGKKEIINTLTPKLNISRRNKQKVLQIEPNTTNEFRIVNGKIVNSHNKEITLQKFKKILDDDKHLNDTNDKLNKQYEQLNMENENIYNTRNNVKLFNNIKNDSKKINVANKKINDDYEQLMKEHENIKHTYNTRSKTKQNLEQATQDKTDVEKMFDILNEAESISNQQYSNGNYAKVTELMNNAKAYASKDFVLSKLYNQKAKTIQNNLIYSSKQAYTNRNIQTFNNRGIHIDYSKYSKDEILNAYENLINYNVPDAMRMSSNRSNTKDKIIGFVNKQLQNNKIDENKYIEELSKSVSERKPRRQRRQRRY